MKYNYSYSILVILCLVCSSALYAQNKTGFYITPGISLLNLNAETSVTIADTAFPDGDFLVSNATTFSFNVGYFFNDNYSVDLQLGLPPSSEITGGGTFEGLAIGSFRYAPTGLTINRHFNVSKQLGFLVGVGANYTYIQSTEGILVNDLTIDNFVSPSIKAGVNINISDKISLIGNIMSVWGSTTTKGFLNPAVPQLGGAPFTTEIELRPLILQAGLRIKLF